MIRTLIRFAALAPLAGAASAQFQPLPNDTLVSFNLGGQSVTTQIVFDAPAGTRQISFEIDSPTAGVDLDLIVRHGSPFAFETPDFDSFLDQAQYFSISPGSEEFVVISDASHFPAREGRWYLAVFNLSNQQSEVRIRAIHENTAPTQAPFLVDYNAPGNNCSVAEWNDERRAALDSAVARLSQAMHSTVPIRIRACWRDYGEDSTTLASAGPSSVFMNFPGAPHRNTFYAQPAVARLSGTAVCKLTGASCGANDLTITFNSRIDAESQPPNLRWHYNTNDGPASGFDFITVAMHELVHGLGFLGLTCVDDRPPGQRSCTPGQNLAAPNQDIYSRQTLFAPPAGPGLPLPDLPTDADRLAALTSVSSLLFDVDVPLRQVSAPQELSRLPLFAPSELQGGSSLSHVDTGAGELQQLMAPSIPPNLLRRQLRYAADVLDKVGWDASPKDPPVFPAPRSGLWFDPSRNGHGIEFSRVADTWVMTMYSYDNSGTPEYFQAVGPMVDGKYVPLVTVGQSNVLRYLYDADRIDQGLPPQFPDSSFIGRATLDFVDAGSYPACRDEFADARTTGGGTHAMRWLLGDPTFRTWCMMPLLPEETRTGTDFTGLWYAGESDPGHGFSITNAEIDGRTVLFAILYYPDAEGRGRWVFAFSDDYQPGQTLPLMQRTGYCRTCPFPPGAQPWTDREVGEVTFNLVQPAFFDPGAGNTASYWIDVPDGPAAGRFERDTFDLIMLTEPVQP